MIKKKKKDASRNKIVAGFPWNHLVEGKSITIEHSLSLGIEIDDE